MADYTNLYTAEDVVEVVVKVGTKKERKSLQDENPGRHVIPNGEIMVKLRKFLSDQEIYPWRSMTSGPHLYIALFDRKDAKIIVRWLREQHVRKSKWAL